ncbi:MAG: tetratricopeptide repeat protein, partial [Gemmatimonadota bacterium]
KDVKQVRDELVIMQARQDSLFHEMQRQNRMLLDTLRTAFVMQADAQGQTSFRFNELADQVARTEQVLVQLQTLVGQLMDRIDRMERPPQVPNRMQGPPAGSSEDAAAAYQAGMQSMTEQSYPAARVAFQAILDNHPNDPAASDAQYQIAESFALEGDTTRAIAEFEKVEANWTHAPRAAEALLRAGILSEESGDKDAAGRYYGRVLQQFPGSDAARIAQEHLSRIRG